MPEVKNSTSKMKILIADDHAIFKGALIVVLKSFFKKLIIDEAWNGDSAIAKIKENDYQIILLDVNMPGTETSTLIKKIIKIKQNATICMLSMYSGDTVKKKYVELGALHYISKMGPLNDMKNAMIELLFKKGSE